MITKTNFDFLFEGKPRLFLGTEKNEKEAISGKLLIPGTMLGKSKKYIWKALIRRVCVYKEIALTNHNNIKSMLI